MRPILLVCAEIPFWPGSPIPFLISTSKLFKKATSRLRTKVKALAGSTQLPRQQRERRCCWPDEGGLFHPWKWASFLYNSTECLLSTYYVPGTFAIPTLTTLFLLALQSRQGQEFSVLKVSFAFKHLQWGMPHQEQEYMINMFLTLSRGSQTVRFVESATNSQEREAEVYGQTWDWLKERCMLGAQLPLQPQGCSHR